MRRTYSCVLVLVVVGLVAGTAWADEITDWNQTMLRAALVGGTSPPVTSRVAAIVQAAVFDAVNGIARRYTPIHVAPAGPAGASREAAAVQAAYATLVQLYPEKKSTFDAAGLTKIRDGSPSPWQSLVRKKTVPLSRAGARGAKPSPTRSSRGEAPMASRPHRLPSSEERPSVSGAPRHPRSRPAQSLSSLT